MDEKALREKIGFFERRKIHRAWPDERLRAIVMTLETERPAKNRFPRMGCYEDLSHESLSKPGFWIGYYQTFPALKEEFLEMVADPRITRVRYVENEDHYIRTRWIES